MVPLAAVGEVALVGVVPRPLLLEASAAEAGWDDAVASPDDIIATALVVKLGPPLVVVGHPLLLVRLCFEVVAVAMRLVLGVPPLDHGGWGLPHVLRHGAGVRVAAMVFVEKMKYVRTRAHVRP